MNRIQFLFNSAHMYFLSSKGVAARNFHSNFRRKIQLYEESKIHILSFGSVMKQPNQHRYKPFFHTTCITAHLGHHHHHPTSSEVPSLPDDVRASRITWIGLWSNVGLTVAKGGIGILSGSASLVADAIHSASDMVSDAVALVSIAVSRRPKDKAHPYGYGHYESLGTLGVSVLLIGAGFATGNHALEHLLPFLGHTAYGDSSTVSMTMIPSAAFVAGLSVVVKEILYQQTMMIGKELRSSVLIANAWHHRSDSLTSIVALVGICGCYMGNPYLDPIGGLLVAGMIVKAGAQIGWDAMQALTDRQTDLDQWTVEKVKEIGGDMAAKTRNEIRDVHEVRCRRLGHYTLVDLHMTVDPRISVTAAYQAGKRMEKNIREQLVGISEVFVHIEAGKDASQCPSSKKEKFTALTDQSGTNIKPFNISYRRSPSNYLGPTVPKETSITKHTPNPTDIFSQTATKTIPSSEQHEADRYDVNVPFLPYSNEAEQEVISNDPSAASSNGENYFPRSRPQFEIEDDLRLALSTTLDKHQHTTGTLGLSHCQIHYFQRAPATATGASVSDGQLLEEDLGVEVNVEMDSSLSINEAKMIAKDAMEEVLKIDYIDSVDIHLELGSKSKCRDSN